MKFSGGFMPVEAALGTLQKRPIAGGVLSFSPRAGGATQVLSPSPTLSLFGKTSGPLLMGISPCGAIHTWE